MILTSSYKVEMKKTYAKILKLFSAYNETFVFLACTSARKQILVHLNKQGTILFQKCFQNAMDSMGMLDQKQIILTQTRQNKITILDLPSHTFTSYPYQFRQEQSDQSQIITFSQTKNLCIEQKGRYGDHRYKLSYFAYPFKLYDKKLKPIAIYESKETQWTYQYATRQADNFSMMCWFKNRHDDSFQFKTYEIVNGKGMYRQYKFNAPISAEMHITKMETVILNVWKLKKNQCLFVCLTNKTQSKKSGGTVINNNYVIDLQKGEISQSNFTFGPFQDCLIDYYNLGLYSMFRTFKLQQGKMLKTPIYYIDNQAQTIIAEQSWECTSLFKYQFPGFGSNIYCEGIYQALQNSRFSMNVKRVYKPLDLYLHLMINSHQTISNELIEDTLSVLGVPLN